MFKSNKCCNGGNKHKFRPRYNKLYNGMGFETTGFSTYDLEKILFNRYYVCDVCE